MGTGATAVVTGAGSCAGGLGGSGGTTSGLTAGNCARPTPSPSARTNGGRSAKSRSLRRVKDLRARDEMFLR